MAPTSRVVSGLAPLPYTPGIGGQTLGHLLQLQTGMNVPGSSARTYISPYLTLASVGSLPGPWDPNVLSCMCLLVICESPSRCSLCEVLTSLI